MPTLAVPRTAPWEELLKRLVTVKPKEAAATIGIDMGSSAIKAVALGRRKGTGPRPVIASEQHVLSERKEDPAAVLRNLIEKLKVPTKSVNLAVSGPSVILRVVEMPAMNPQDLKRALPFEAQRYLPFPIQDVMLDGQLLGSIDARKVWVLVVACKKDLIEQKLELLKRAGLEPGIIDVDALALANAFGEAGMALRKAPTSALIHAGAQLCSVVIFKGTSPYLVRDIPWGADRLTRELSQQLGRDAAGIQQILGQAEAPAETLDALRGVVEGLVVELQLSFDYFENQFGQPPEEVFISGGLTRSPAFVQTLKSQLTQSVAPWEPAPGVSGQFAVGYGLALRSV